MLTEPLPSGEAAGRQSKPHSEKMVNGSRSGGGGNGRERV